MLMEFPVLVGGALPHRDRMAIDPDQVALLAPTADDRTLLLTKSGGAFEIDVTYQEVVKRYAAQRAVWPCGAPAKS